jgi:hypothetical protein
MDEAWAGIAQVSQKGDANIVGWCAVHGGSCRCPFHGVRAPPGVVMLAPPTIPHNASRAKIEGPRERE